MKKRNLLFTGMAYKKRFPAIVLMNLLLIGVLGVLPAVLPSAFAQGHAGHSVQPPAAEKQGAAVKPEGIRPVPAEAEEEVPQVEITPEQQQQIGVKTVKVSVISMQKIIRTVGRIDVDERKQATINTKIEGWIEKLFVDFTGRYVKKGEALAEIYSPELLATQLEFISILKWTGRQTDKGRQKDAAREDREETPHDTTSGSVSEWQNLRAKDAAAALDAARQRLSLWDISEQQIAEIEKTRTPLRTLTLYSPIGGFITQKMAVQGMKVMPGEKLFDVADLSNLWIIADVYEEELPFIRVGQPARISLSYYPGKELSSQIDYIFPTIAADTRTAKVRLILSNGDGLLKPQMYANVEIRINLGKRLAIPESAVIDTGREQVVYVDRDDGSFEPREVQLGLRSNGYAEVLRGLKSGEKIASAANFLIDSEAQLKGIKPLRQKR